MADSNIMDGMDVTTGAAAPNRQIRVLVMLGGIPLHGQERGNIQVFKSLASVGIDALFVTHAEYGHEAIQPALDRLGLKWTTATYPGRLSKGMSPAQWVQRLGEIRRANRDFLRAVREYDPTHIHVCNEGHLLTMLPAVIRARRPVVFRVGDAPRDHRPVFRYLWRNVFNRVVDRFVCNSRFIQERLIDAGVPSETITHIYTLPPERPPRSVNGDSWLGGSMGESRGDAALREVIATAFPGWTFVYMGQLSQEKGVDLLVRSAIRFCRERPDVRFLIAGDYIWQNPFSRGLMEEVEAAGLTDRISFLGFVEDVPALLDLADAHLCPSVWAEPLSNTVLEAKRSGVPSIVFASGGLPELIDDGVDGIVVEGKTKEGLYAAIDTIMALKDDELRLMKTAARSSLERLGITPERFTTAWAEVYAAGR